MINIGTLNSVEGFTFAYSGTLQLGDKNFIVVGFETNTRGGKRHFDIKIVENQSEMDIVIATFQQKLDEPKPKKVFDWSKGEDTLTLSKPKPKTLELF
jgi:hypothetical protein